MSSIILEIDSDELSTGFITATKVDGRGRRKGKMPLTAVADLLREVCKWDAAGRQIRMISRFDNTSYLAFGINGPKWVAVVEIASAEYYLVSVAKKAYPVRLPRLVAKVGSHSDTFLYWTEDEQLTPASMVYPLIIGNIDSRGWVCMGTSTLKCKRPEDTASYIRKVIEVPATGTYVPNVGKLDDFYERLAKGWDPEIGRTHGVTLAKLLAPAD